MTGPADRPDWGDLVFDFDYDASKWLPISYAGERPTATGWARTAAQAWARDCGHPVDGQWADVFARTLELIAATHYEQDPYLQLAYIRDRPADAAWIQEVLMRLTPGEPDAEAFAREFAALRAEESIRVPSVDTRSLADGTTLAIVGAHWPGADAALQYELLVVWSAASDLLATLHTAGGDIGLIESMRDDLVDQAAGMHFVSPP